MKNKKVAFITLGCKVNQYESNGMAQKLQKEGYEIVEINEKPDIAIVNTCTVTNMSDRKSRQMIRKVKEENKNAIVVAVGCYAQVAKDALEKMDEIDLVLGNTEKNQIAQYIKKFQENNDKLYEVSDISKQKEFCDFGTTTYTEKARASIKIQDGCNNFCTYCLIPYARGRIRSRQPQSIIDEVTEIAKRGIKEVVITGIHIASYGKDLDGYILIDLLEELNKIDGIKRIRLGSLEPTIVTEEFANRLSNLEKICNHFHLSLQSGCNETLKRMNRHYSTEEFKKCVQILRKYFKDVNLTTDIIVGFPGETDEEFEKTYEFLKSIKFYKMHIFKYSKRDGTKAAVMPNQIDGNIKEARSKRLIELSNKNQAEYNKKYEGRILEVLFEEKDGEYFVGHTTNYMRIKSKDVKISDNDFYDVTIGRNAEICKI